MLSPLDDFPYHQTSEPIAVVGTSDRNFYDRYYFNLYSIERDLFVTAGLGQYPNLGVTDGFVSATTASRQHVVRASRELGLDRSDTSVGPLSVEIYEGLKRLRLRLEEAGGGVALDVTWTPSIPAFLEARHVNRRGVRITTDTSRFAQTGFWSGSLRIGDEQFEVEPSTWWGGRDRSWGIRPVGEAEPNPRREGDRPGGFLWLYCTMQFSESTIVCILQEDSLGRRSLEQAVRVWSDPGREPVDLGRVEHDITFVDGSRRIKSMNLRFRDGSGSETVVEAEPFGASYLSLGTGYGMDDSWRNGQYQGRLAVQHCEFDLTDGEVVKRSYGLIDNVASYRLDGETGYGLLENAVLGPNLRYGLATR